MDYLFKQVAALRSKRIVASILTGMGKDGAQGMAELKKIGAATLAQNESSCAVYGMPLVAIELGVVDHITPLEAMAETILNLSNANQKAA